jgi:hypothetical protein
MRRILRYDLYLIQCITSLIFPAVFEIHTASGRVHESCNMPVIIDPLLHVGTS